MKVESISAEDQYLRIGSLYVAWLIAWRQISEGLRNRSTWIITLFTTAMPLVLLLLSLRPALQDHKAISNGTVGLDMAFYLLWLGLTTTLPALGIAAGAFAGERENGSLAPLLVTPVTNLAIFFGKVLGAILPALATSLLGMLLYLVEIIVFFGGSTLVLLPIGLTTLVVLLIPAIALFGAGLAALISSRVKTFQTAQNYGSLILMVLWVGMIALVLLVSRLGLWSFAVADGALYSIDLLVIVLSASTWRREEVLARQ